MKLQSQRRRTLCNSLTGAVDVLTEVRCLLDQALVQAEDRLQECLAVEVNNDEVEPAPERSW